MKTKRNSWFWMLMLILCQCIEPYDFEVLDSEEVLVVDAKLTTEEKVQVVKLSLSFPLDQSNSKPVSGAEIWMEDLESNKFDFKESETSGTYHSSDVFCGEMGQSYALYIMTTDGDEFQSAYEEVPSPVAIDSIYGRYTESYSTTNDEFLRGIQFFVDNHNTSEAFSNYRFEFTEHYQIDVPYPSMYEWVYDSLLLSREVSVATCYDSIVSNELITETTSGQTENRLSEQPLVFVRNSDPQLQRNYSITLKQFAISSGAYQYYKDLKENNESSGSFFDEQKGTILGNMEYLGSSEKTILGYFEVSGVTVSTRYFSSGEFRDQGFLPTPFIDCFYTREVKEVPFEDLRLINGLGVSSEVHSLSFPFPDTAYVLPAKCSNCLTYGHLEKPEFWE